MKFDVLGKSGGGQNWNICDLEVDVRRGSGDKPLVTDGGNYILDCACSVIPDPAYAAELLSVIPGVVEHGLFIGLARTVIIGSDEGASIFEY